MRSAPTIADNPRARSRLQPVVPWFLAVALLSAALAAPDALAQKPPATDSSRVMVDRVVAVVNDDVILHSELMRRVVPLSAELQDITDERERNRRQDKLKDQILDEMISEELIVQAAVESKLEVGAKEVQAALEDIKKQNKLDDTQFAEALRLQGYTMAGYRRDVRRQLLRFRAVNMIVRPKVQVSDDEVKARYEEMSRRSAAIKRVHLRHVLVALPDDPSSQQIAAAKTRATDVLERARKGEDFATLAQRYSDDEATSSVGGDLGWIERGSIATEWEVIVFSMNKGETRGPINGPRGLHVFHVEDVEKSQQKPFEEAKEQIRGELFRQALDRQTRQWIDELRKKAHVQKKL
jgi:peptidyl-prolyl cis-trans isomerase SurA